jgi:hypothetical protein
MRYARIALLSAVVASLLLPLATPAVAELGHPSGCFMCSPVEVTGGFLSEPIALAPETDLAAAPKTRHVR